jgi:hypothetical protein
VGIAVASFILSFFALTELVEQYLSAGNNSWMWAVTLDGLIVTATIALVALADAPRRERTWATMLLAAGIILSTIGNITHAYVNSYGVIGAAIAALPPLMLAAVTHLTIHLTRNVLKYDSRKAQTSVYLSDHEPLQERLDGLAEFFERTPDKESPVVAVSAENDDLVQPSNHTHTGEVTSLRSIERPSVEEVNQWIWGRIDEGEEPTGNEIGERFDISPATGRRWKTRAIAARQTEKVDALTSAGH